MVKCQYKKWTTQRKRKIDLYCPFFKQSFDWDASTVRLYGMQFELLENMELVDDRLGQLFPALIQ